MPRKKIKKNYGDEKTIKEKDSDLNSKSSLGSKKVLGELDEGFRDIPILDRGRVHKTVVL